MKPVTDLTPQQRSVLERVEEIWVYFHQIYPYVNPPLAKRRVAAILRGLVRRGLLASRRNDVPGQGGHTEYAITEKGDQALWRT